VSNAKVDLPEPDSLGDHDQLLMRQHKVNVLEVVEPRATDNDVVLGRNGLHL
jgi:hypothetical protein